MTVRKEIDKSKQRKCLYCGAEGQYTVIATRDFKPIYDGPYREVGYEDNGTYVKVECSVCKCDLDPTEEEINRLFAPRKGVVFY
jgi:hypothetical protein